MNGDWRTRLLILDDDENDAWFVVRELTKGGFDLDWLRVDDALTMREALQTRTWDLVICDYSMPGFDVFSALRLIELSDLDLPFIVVSGAIGEDRAAAVMRAGAHDCVLKQSLSRLAPAVRRELQEAAVRDERRRTEQMLHDSNRRFETLVENSPAFITRFDRDLTMTFVNSAVGHRFGVAPEQLVGRRFPGVDTPIGFRQVREIEQRIRAVFETGRPNRVELPLTATGGDSIWVDLHMAPERDAAGELTHVQVVGTEITDLKNFEEQLRRQALHDPLTGLPNRALLMDRLEQAIARDPELPNRIAVAFVDIDRFKVINDALGHAAGDAVLRQVAERLASVVRRDDTVARIGGDEFVVLAQLVRGHAELRDLAERIADTFTEPFVAGGETIEVAASVGAASARLGDTSADSLIQDADTAMYRAKGAGGGRAALFDDSQRANARARLTLEQELRRAIREEEIRVYYQPEFRISDGRIIGAEALVRWDHPRQGVLLPMEFLPLAEETGLIVPIGQIVLHNALDQAATWARERDFVMWINLSARELAQPGLTSQISGLLHASRMPPGTIAFEITESTLLDDLRHASTVMRLLCDLGVHLCLDDFGTGYSSLTYLRRFPFSGLKIDRSFVQELTHDKGDKAIVNATIEMAHALGLVVHAEGIETMAHLNVLRTLGCDLGQGFLLSQALPASELTAMLECDRSVLSDPSGPLASLAGGEPIR